MNRSTLETQWGQIREILRDKFNLTDEDIRQINGQYDQLVAKLQQKYGYSREEAEERIRNWNFDRFADNKAQPRRDERFARRDEDLRSDYTSDNSSILKWLLAIGIPLILLGSYFLSTRAPEATRTAPPVAQEQMVIETPADRAISSSVRASLFQNMTPAQLQNIQITTRNGVVTLTGFVPSENASDTIENAAQDVSGVRQVINNLQVR